MRHLTFYYAIGFAIVGCLMLGTNLSTFIGMVLQNYDPYAIAVLATAMLLPFMIATLSWRDWREIQGKKDTFQEDLKTRARALWTGRPWILPNVLTRSILIIVIAVGISWLEFLYSIAYKNILNIQIILWTGLVIFLVWVISLMHLLSLRASNTYILRNDGLEIRVGILTSKSFVIAPSGFSDLEVTRSISARIINSGDITIRTQGESDIEMEKVRNPLKVADQIREVMARPIVRIEGQQPIRERK
jgi:membrane protein YdbS with pleckstrin-like domain